MQLSKIISVAALVAGAIAAPLPSAEATTIVARQRNPPGLASNPVTYVKELIHDGLAARQQGGPPGLSSAPVVATTTVDVCERQQNGPPGLASVPTTADNFDKVEHLSRRQQNGPPGLASVPAVDGDEDLSKRQQNAPPGLSSVPNGNGVAA